MKKLLLLLFVSITCTFAVQAEASLYRLDNNAVEQMFASAEKADLTMPLAMAPFAGAGNSAQAYLSEKNPAVAFILAWAFGYLGIHRAYLGTSTGTIIAYIVTLGGCGVVALVDWVVLLIGLIDDDISKYVDNPKFFMW